MIDVTESLTIENEKNVQNLKGKKVNNIICYSDENFENYLIISNDKVTLKRKSKEIVSIYEFILDKLTDVTYIVNGHNISGIRIKTTKIDKTSTDILICYEITLENIKKCELKISYKEKIN